MMPLIKPKYPKRATCTASAALENLRWVLVAAVVLALCGLALAVQGLMMPKTPLRASHGMKASASGGKEADTVLHAAQEHANELQQDTKQQQQQQQGEHQQHQQSLAELKQQHEKQTELLSMVQKGQFRVQAGVQKLHELLGYLNKTTALGVASTSAATQPISSAAPLLLVQQQQRQEHQPSEHSIQHGVLCTMVRNEARYVPEWVAFHLLMGATRIVMYNDNSTDGIKEAVAPFGDQVVLVDMNRVEGVPGDLGLHRQASRQDWAFQHCKTTYAPANGTGWLGIWDVDEFVFPCMRPGVQLLGANVLWDTYVASTQAGADGHALHCSIFGQNHKDTPQSNDELVLVNNIRRAPHPLTEPVAAAKAWEAVAEGCMKVCCCENDFRKTIYNMSRVDKLWLGTHAPHNKAVIDNSWQKPLAGLCCNHYQFKSTKEAKAKGADNKNPLYDRMISIPDAKKHYTMLEDTVAWQYLPDLVQLLQQKGFKYKMPQLPLLIKRD